MTDFISTILDAILWPFIEMLFITPFALIYNWDQLETCVYPSHQILLFWILSIWAWALSGLIANIMSKKDERNAKASCGITSLIYVVIHTFCSVTGLMFVGYNSKDCYPKRSWWYSLTKYYFQAYFTFGLAIEACCISCCIGLIMDPFRRPPRARQHIQLYVQVDRNRNN